VLTGIVIDALDLAVMERFWQAATQGRTGGLELWFEPTRTPKAGKNRLHLDLAGGPDWAAEVERLLALGARQIDIGQGNVPWDVLADPEGNEFCVLRPGHDGVIPDAGLAAICLDMAAQDRATQLAFWRSVSGWHQVDEYPWGVRLRRASTSPVSLVMGPPAAPKSRRNRLRLEVVDPSPEGGERQESGHVLETGEHCDPAGNEFHVRDREPRP